MFLKPICKVCIKMSSLVKNYEGKKKHLGYWISTMFYVLVTPQTRWKKGLWDLKNIFNVKWGDGYIVVRTFSLIIVIPCFDHPLSQSTIQYDMCLHTSHLYYSITIYISLTLSMPTKGWKMTPACTSKGGWEGGSDCWRVSQWSVPESILLRRFWNLRKWNNESKHKTGIFIWTDKPCGELEGLQS